MYELKSEKGVTMTVLAITIILLFILAMISINFGKANLIITNNYKLSSELNIVQHAVLEQYTKYKTTNNPSYIVGSKVSTQEVTNIANEMGVTLVTIPDTYANRDYYKLDEAALSSIGIKDSTDEYIVNYVSGEVINITTKKLKNGEALYAKAVSVFN